MKNIASKERSLINYDLTRDFPQVARGDGVYLWDIDGRRCLDGCGGALVANLGHNLPEMLSAMASQVENLPYVYRYHYSTPEAERLAARYCRLTDDPMGMAYFTNSGSEAVETAVKLARVRHLAVGEKDRYKIISRWQSYHGITMGALSWTGYTARRADYLPYLKDGIHIPPAYCYRCWFDLAPHQCGLECAKALEHAVMQADPDTVAAFIAEPVVGSSLAAAVPPEGYFSKIREICDRYGILYLAEEVMTGAGRTGGTFFASDHFPGQPDMIIFGKGVGAGYFPLGGVMVSKEIADDITAGPGGFAAGQSHSADNLGMAVGHAVLDYMEKHDLTARAADRGKYLGEKLAGLRKHPTVGDIRGMGLMWGLEFVRDRETKQIFAPEEHYHQLIYEEARRLGLLFLPGAGCDHGKAGDMALLGPPLTISESEIDEMVDALDKALTIVEKRF